MRVSWPFPGAGRRLVPLLGVVLAVASMPASLRAQGQPAPLEAWVAGVARMWSAGEAERLVALAPADARIILDLDGGGPGAVQPRHAAAALRRLFAERETSTVRVARVTLSGGTPVRGFGELTWVGRPRGVTAQQTVIVYLGAVWEDGAWRLRELRLVR
jgi:hypothetical protein